MFGIRITHEGPGGESVAVWLKRPHWLEAGRGDYALAGAIVKSQFTIYGP